MKSKGETRLFKEKYKGLKILIQTYSSGFANMLLVLVLVLGSLDCVYSEVITQNMAPATNTTSCLALYVPLQTIRPSRRC
jgi:hypothetical protein